MGLQNRTSELNKMVDRKRAGDLNVTQEAHILLEARIDCFDSRGNLDFWRTEKVPSTEKVFGPHLPSFPKGPYLSAQ
jgi:hypothetical protein